MGLLAEQLHQVEVRAASVDHLMAGDPFVFTDALDGGTPWRPGAVSLYFQWLRQQLDLDHLSFTRSDGSWTPMDRT